MPNCFVVVTGSVGIEVKLLSSASRRVDVDLLETTIGGLKGLSELVGTELRGEVRTFKFDAKEFPNGRPDDFEAVFWEVGFGDEGILDELEKRLFTDHCVTISTFH